MSRRTHPAVAATSLALALMLAPGSALGDQFYSSSGRADFFDSNGPVRARDTPDLVLLTRVPDLLDPAEDSLSLICSLLAFEADGFTRVSKVKARYTVHLVMLDLDSGTFTSDRIASGKLKTGDPGNAELIAVDPSPLIGRFPGQTVAYLQTSLRMTNRRTVSALTALCDIGLRVEP